MDGQSMDGEVRETTARMAAYMQHRLGNLYTGMRMIVDAVPETGHSVPSSLAPRVALAADELERMRVFSVRLGQAFGPLPTPSPSFLEDVVARCCAVFQAKHVELRIHRIGFDSARVARCGWGNYLEAALLELLENAANNLSGSDGIEVELRFTENSFCIAVHQEGEWSERIPITPPLPFLGGKDGAGLGLTIVHRLSDAMGGSLALFAEREGVVTVRMSVPLESVDA